VAMDRVKIEIIESQLRRTIATWRNTGSRVPSPESLIARNDVEPCESPRVSESTDSVVNKRMLRRHQRRSARRQKD
jgi:hypothetical protein